MVAGIALFVMGLGVIGWGTMYAFNLRGAVDKAVARRNAVRAVTATRTMNLGLTEPSRLGAWFFRLMGAVMVPGGLFLALVGLVIASLEN
ncbi:hypothetical protein [Streptomyces laurentii]|uniref:hypothetical protein n=1 Tax=Streptomyces laurentii TaxID=39478 RepID=UPI003696CC03